MIDRTLKAGDHVMDVDGRIYAIERVSEDGYVIVSGYLRETIPPNGITRRPVREYFACGDAQRQVVENLNKRIEAQAREYFTLLDKYEKAKTFLDNLEFLGEVRLRDAIGGDDRQAEPDPDDYWEDEDV